MRMAYLVLAHDNAAQLRLLIERLLVSGNEDIAIIHADRASLLWPELEGELPGPSGRVHLIPDPVTVRWGHWSQVAAVTKLVCEGLRLGCDAAHLISGADWPLLPRADLAQEMAKGLCHIEVRPGHLEERMQTYRFDTRYLRLDPQEDARAYALTWQLRRLARWGDTARRLLHLDRARPFGPWSYGATWWSLPADALQTLGEILPCTLASGRLNGTVCSDEHVIPTIIGTHFPGRLAPNRRFVDFPEGASSPRTLSRADTPALEASGAFFARKFDMGLDSFFLDLPRT
ncbi:glycosyl transferase [Novosphingobium profundi]|uniref:glycosyl transferase n=1 Tax=Novosphingobium profundi TaxID=1774954 RepID=UPI001CFC7201|nr:glycosyl transferase [Novosphingobium profundi]